MKFKRVGLHRAYHSIIFIVPKLFIFAIITLGFFFIGAFAALLMLGLSCLCYALDSFFGE